MRFQKENNDNIKIKICSNILEGFAYIVFIVFRYA